MYQPSSRFAYAGARYQTVDLAARIESATPHQLVTIQYDELRRSLALMRAGIRTRDYTRRGEAQARALTILSGLSGALDHGAGEISQTLARVYREARRLVLKGGAESSEAPVVDAGKLIDEIAAAWSAIG